jgi:hypothetical protein
VKILFCLSRQRMALPLVSPTSKHHRQQADQGETNREDGPVAHVEA